ncbi:MAG: membrane protein insertase YidC [Planctomycetes bacterium]|nr:membrane protein insertase YidC [Planctomycetota bacterium]
MEKRVVLVAVLSFLVFMGWAFVAQWLFPPPKPRPKPKPVARDEEPRWAEVKKAPPAEIAPVEETVHPLREDIVLENGFFRATFTNRGAGLRRLELLKYLDRDGVVPLLEPFDPAEPHLSIHFPDEPGLHQATWEVKEEPAAGRVIFRRTLRNGLRVEKEFAFGEKPYEIALMISLQNPSGEARSVRMQVHAFNGMPHDSDYRYEAFAMGYAGVKDGGYSLRMTGVGEVAEKEKVVGRKDVGPEAALDSVGLRNRYFTVALLPADDFTRERAAAVEFAGFAKEALAGAGGKKNIHARVTLADPKGGELTVRERADLRYTLFGGPLQNPVLESAGHGLSGLHSYGSGCFIFAPLVNLVAPLLLFIMTTLFKIVGNYGVAIILTTLVVRLCLFPLSRKTTISMSRMSELSPKVQLLRERYADNPQKMNQEMMKLWKEHGVNPLSGCLPMLLQLPIWIGMFSVIDLSIELRHAPFMLWIHDLSQPDKLVDFSREIPLLFTSISAINVLPIVMTITWFLQAYFAPRSPDPQAAAQQKMMLFMPIMFGLFTYSYGSGLALYFIVNSLLAMAEQKIIKKVWLKPPPKPA